MGSPVNKLSFISNSVYVSMERIIVLTGIEPYGKQRRSVTKELALKFNKAKIRNFTVRSVVFPHDLRTIKQKIMDVVNEDPEFIVCLGTNERDGKVRIEKTARNVIDYDEEGIVDNMGYKPTAGFIEKDAQDFLENKFDTSRIEIDFKTTKVPYKISRDAGTTFNNVVLFHALSVWRRGLVFLSLPYAPETVLNKKDASLSFATQEKLLSLMLKDIVLGLEG